MQGLSYSFAGSQFFLNLSNLIMIMKFRLLFFSLVVLSSSIAKAQTTLVLQPDSTGKDAIVDFYYPTVDNSASPEFNSIAWTHFGNIENERSLAEFDLSAVPQGAVINSATLFLYNNPTSINGLLNGQHSQLSGSNASWLRRITDPWTESVNWNTQPATTTQNQVYVPADTNVNQDYVCDVTQLVIDMINNPSASFGFMLQLETETYYRCLLFASGDHPDSSLHPKLVIVYTACTSVPQAAFTAPAEACQGTCIDFINLSSNATSYLWYFPGAVPDTSTAANPTQICYPTAGQYGVTLISTNGNCSDTITIPTAVTVFAPTLPQGIIQNGDSLISDTGFVSYQWYFNGSQIAGATDYYYVATSSGDYNVICTDVNGCEVEAVIFSVVAGIPGSHSASFSLYLDAFTKHLVIMKEVPSKMDLTIVDVLGKELLRQSVSGNKAELDVHFLSVGIYFLQVQDQGEKYTLKFFRD
jgi:hypothetical protein